MRNRIQGIIKYSLYDKFDLNSILVTTIVNDFLNNFVVTFFSNKSRIFFIIYTFYEHTFTHH